MLQVIRAATACKDDKAYSINILDNANCNGSGCHTFLSIVPNNLNISLSVVSSNNVTSLVVSGNSISFYCTDFPWSINLTADLSSSGLNPGDSFSIGVEFSPAVCGTPWPVLPPVIVEACTAIISDPGFSIPLFKCSCNKNVKHTIVSTTSFIFHKMTGRFFYNRSPKW